MTAATDAEPRTVIYGARISGEGEVYGFLALPVRGHCPESQQALLGHVWKVKGGWKTDVCCDVYPSQTDAADAVVRITCGPDRSLRGTSWFRSPTPSTARRRSPRKPPRS